MGYIGSQTQFVLYFHLIFAVTLIILGMSSHYQYENNSSEELKTQSKVKLTDLLSRINEERKIERNRNLALSVAAISAVTVFGIILTL